MAPCGFALLCRLVGEAAEVAGVAAGIEGSAGPGTETVATGAGFTIVGLSHALKASDISTAGNTIEYFMRIPFNRLTKAACLDRFAATWGRDQQV